MRNYISVLFVILPLFVSCCDEGPTVPPFHPTYGANVQVSESYPFGPGALTVSTVMLDSVVFDTDGIFNPAEYNFTVTEDDTYEVYAQVTMTYKPSWYLLYEDGADESVFPSDPMEENITASALVFVAVNGASPVLAATDNLEWTFIYTPSPERDSEFIISWPMMTVNLCGSVELMAGDVLALVARPGWYCDIVGGVFTFMEVTSD